MYVCHKAQVKDQVQSCKLFSKCVQTEGKYTIAPVQSFKTQVMEEKKPTISLLTQTRPEPQS